MAVQGSQDVKIFSSVRPLQIQRSFEGPPEVADNVGSVTPDGTIEKRSSVTITSQTSSTGMSTADGSPTSPFSATPGTVIIKAAASPTSPGTVLIRSSVAPAATAEAWSATPGVGGQNVVIIRSPSAVSPTGPAPHTGAPQSAIVIKSGTTTPVAVSGSKPNAQSKIVINPAPLTQSRITITGGASPTSTAPQAAEVVSNEAPANQAPPQGRRSSLTIKTAPSPTSPTPPSIQQHGAVVIGGPLSNQSPVSDHLPQGAPVNEHRTPEPIHPPTAAQVIAQEDLSEKIHQKKPAGPSLEEILEKVNISKVFIVALLVLVAAVFCILTDGEVPLSWILAAISAVSLGSFIALRL